MRRPLLTTIFNDKFQAFDLFPQWKPVVLKSRELTLKMFQKQYPDAERFIDYTKQPGGMESLLEDSIDGILKKLLYSTENYYYIGFQSSLKGTLKKNYGLNLNEAFMMTAASSDYLGNILTKNCPWTPIISMGLLKLKVQFEILTIFFVDIINKDKIANIMRI